jgi:hypothetical protein
VCAADKTHPTFAAEKNMIARDLQAPSRRDARKTPDFCSQNVGPPFRRQNASQGPAMTYDEPLAKLENKTQKTPSASEFCPRARASGSTKAFFYFPSVPSVTSVVNSANPVIRSKKSGEVSGQATDKQPVPFEQISPLPAARSASIPDVLQ